MEQVQTCLRGLWETHGLELASFWVPWGGFPQPGLQLDVAEAALWGAV